jgi:hypothetical protein
VRAEAFTSPPKHGYGDTPADLKNQADWAFAIGINDLMFHTYQHQPLGLEGPKPGMAMGPYGVHWHRNQTFWPMVRPFHDYLARCGQLLRQGISVTDILYLTPEGAPHIFEPPEDAMTDGGLLRDKKGHGFDVASPLILLDRATVRNRALVFPGGSSYRVLVLPLVETMTPELLTRLDQLIRAGLTVIGRPPIKSPSLVGFPECDETVRMLARAMWGGLDTPADITERNLGQGRILWGGPVTTPGSVDRLYPTYASTTALLREWGAPPAFESPGPVRSHQRRTDERDLFFVSNRDNRMVETVGRFRTDGGAPELWNPVDGTRHPLRQFSVQGNLIEVPLRFAPHESYFVVFNRPAAGDASREGARNFAEETTVARIPGPYQVIFDPAWGGPEQPVVFEQLSDWKDHAEPGIRYYSGKAVYRKTFASPPELPDAARVFLDLGGVHKLARVKLNDEDLGIVWTPPYRVEVTGKLKPGNNELEVIVVNTWVNRLIGDQQPGNKNVRTLQWENGMLAGQPQPAGRYTFTTAKDYTVESPLEESGLLGPVQLITTVESTGSSGARPPL